MECAIEIINSPPVTKLFQQYYLNAKPEEEKRIIQDAMVREGGGVSASMQQADDDLELDELEAQFAALVGRNIDGGGRHHMKRKSKKRKSKTRRRRRR